MSTKWTVVGSGIVDALRSIGRSDRRTTVEPKESGVTMIPFTEKQLEDLKKPLAEIMGDLHREDQQEAFAAGWAACASTFHRGGTCFTAFDEWYDGDR